MEKGQKKLFIGNLPYNGTTEAALREVFEQFGTVHEVKLINDRETQRFRGFGFITMDAQAADDAKTALDDSTFGDRQMRVNEAEDKPRKDRPQRTSNPYENRR